MDDIYAEILISIVAIMVMYFFAKWISDKAFKQVEDANKMVTDSHEKFVDFIESAYTKNVNVTEDLVTTLKDYIKSREEKEKKDYTSNKED